MYSALTRAESMSLAEVTWRQGEYDLMASKSRNTWTRSATQYLDGLAEAEFGGEKTPDQVVSGRSVVRSTDLLRVQNYIDFIDF